MPKFSIPVILDGIEQFGACAIFDEGHEELREWARDLQQTDSCCVYDEDGQERWLTLSLNCCKDHVHFHIEISRVDLRTSKEDELVPLDQLTGTIDKVIERASGIEAVVQSRGRLRIPRKEIPEHGIIANLLGFKKQSCGATFSLRSGSLDIEDESFTKLDFRFDEEDNEVRTQLWAAASLELEHDYLDGLMELMSTGADCFVFERIAREQTT